MARLGIIATVLLVAGSSFATTIHVPADQPTIQAGIDAASNEDTVLVAPGTYVENVDFGPKNAIFLLSEQGRDVTAIRSGSAGKPVINVPNHSDTTSIIRGFTVTDANDAPGIQASGGRIIEECRVANGSSDGIYCLGTFQIIRKCLVYGNFAGGCDGIIFYGDSCEILNNETYDNHQSGIYVASGRGLIAYNLIRDNYDWGIYCPSEFRIRNNTVLRNPNGGIFLETQEQQTHVLNNIVSGNGNGIVVEGTTTIDYNDLWQNGGGGNDAGQHGIYADPLFISPSMNNYRLSSGSPCIDAGDPDPQYNDPNGTRNDMGALPYPARSWHVSLDGDDVAGDGSQLNPFATIQRGVDTAGNGDTVLVADGTYTGDGNRDINILGKAVVVMSAGGPENTIMDCQATAEDQHVAFWLDLDGDMSTVISGFTIRNAWRVDYAAVYCSGGPVLLDNCILRDNHCNAVYQHGGTGSALVMRNCRITSNSGRGLDCAYSRVDITESVFDSNLVAGARVTWGGSGAFKKCTFVGNGGAGVDGSYTETLSIDSCIFDGNGGAGLCGSDGDEPHLFTVRDSRFENNQGAGFDVPTSQGLTHMVERCYFGNNHGSGVRREVEAALALTDCVFVENSAQEGGAVNLTLDGNGTSAFDKCIFLGNLAQTGGAICLNRNLATFTNCTFVDNEAPNGSSIYNRSYNTVPVSNTVIAFGDSPPIVCEEGSRGVEIVCTNIYANTGGDWVGCIADQYGQNGNISLDPLFCDTANGNYSLYDFSPCAAANNSCGQLIGAFDVGCNLATTIALPDETDSLHVKSHMPHLAWAFEPASLFQQTEYEVELGSDNDWAVAEVWDPDVVVTGLSELVYQGPELLDGATYYVRLRTKLNGVWSPWYETSFRMNSLPGAPTVATPLADAVTGAQPSLYVYHSTDAEGDPVQYQFEVYLVSQPPQQVAVSELVDEQADSTGWTVWAVLEDNATYWWHGRAWDGYEYSEWSISRFFSVNTLPQAPSNPSLVAPMGEDLILYDMLPTFNWTVAADPDPGDQVHYRLELSLNQNFTLVVPFDNIAQTSMQVPDSLEFNTRYWWRVKAVDLVGLFGVSEPADFWTWTLGDVNYDHDMTLGDIMILVDHLFISGIAITPPKAGDVNHDCEITLGDIMIMVDNLFISGAELQVGCEL